MSLANRAPDAAAAAPEYVKHLLAILGDRDPLQVQEQLLSHVREAVAGMDAAAARLPEAPGKWAVVEVVQHLADTEVVYGYRMRMILAHQEPEIQGYDQDLWAERLHYREREMDDALSDLAAFRGANLRLLRGLVDVEWRRCGLHSERGPESVRRIAELIAAHDLVHLRQIRRIRAAIDA